MGLFLPGSPAYCQMQPSSGLPLLRHLPCCQEWTVNTEVAPPRHPTAFGVGGAFDTESSSLSAFPLYRLHLCNLTLYSLTLTRQIGTCLFQGDFQKSQLNWIVKQGSF
jgi:hypothetical protein